MTGARSRWDAGLEDIEAGIDRAEVAAATGEVSAVPPWTPPEGLGPLPTSLLLRAQAMSWRLAAVEQRTRERRDALEAELDDLDRRRGAGAAYAAQSPLPVV